VILGVGLDVVDVAGFAEQLADPASAFVERTFRPAEQRRSREHPDRARHLAGRFAAKEAFLKAWSSSRRGQPPALTPADLDLRDIEVVDDGFGRPSIRLHGAVRRAVDPAMTGFHLSISHDGPVAAAVVVLEEKPRAPES
jgi:holo-[acyl-carrier protein] synthase